MPHAITISADGSHEDDRSSKWRTVLGWHPDVERTNTGGDIRRELKLAPGWVMVSHYRHDTNDTALYISGPGECFLQMPPELDPMLNRFYPVALALYEDDRSRVDREYKAGEKKKADLLSSLFDAINAGDQVAGKENPHAPPED